MVTHVKDIKKYFLLVFLFFFGANVLYAEDIKIAFVNATRVMNEVPQADAIRKRIKDEFAPRDKKILEMQTELKKQEDKMLRDSEVMSDAARTKLERKIFTLKRDIKRAREEFTEDLNIRRNEELDKLQKLVYKAILSYAKQNKYDLILGESVLYSSKRVDVSDKVIERLREEYQNTVMGTKNN